MLVLMAVLMRTASPETWITSFCAFLNTKKQILQSIPFLESPRATLIYPIYPALLPSAQHLSQLDLQLLCSVWSRYLASAEDNFVTTNK